jgi:hypothetical protein
MLLRIAYSAWWVLPLRMAGLATGVCCCCCGGWRGWLKAAEPRWLSWHRQCAARVPVAAVLLQGRHSLQTSRKR